MMIRRHFIMFFFRDMIRSLGQPLINYFHLGEKQSAQEKIRVRTDSDWYHNIS